MALLTSGQITSSSTPMPLSSTPVGARKWILKVLDTNGSQIGIGPQTQPGGATLSMSNAYLMDPGDDLEVDTTIQPGGVFSDFTPDKVYVVGTGAVVTWLAIG